MADTSLIAASSLGFFLCTTQVGSVASKITLLCGNGMTDRMCCKPVVSQICCFSGTISSDYLESTF